MSDFTRDPIAERISSHPKYLELRRKRNRLGGWLTVLMLVVYYGYISLIAFDKPFLVGCHGPGQAHQGGRDRRSPRADF